MPVVYLHRSPSGRGYVGWTSGTMRDRWLEHVREARAGSSRPLHRAIRKYGPEVFTHEVLEQMTTEAGAKRAEQLWIDRLATFGAGYNATRGGEGLVGFRPSEETRAKMRAAHAGKTHPRRGVTPSTETRAKIAAAKRGRKHSAEHVAAQRAGALRRRAAA